MWDMSGDPFENELSRLFLKPSGEADASHLKLQVLERLQREDRRRGAMITIAAGLGAAIAASTVAASRAPDFIGLMAAQLSAALPQAGSLGLWNPTSLLASLMVLGLGAVLAARLLRDV